MRGAVAREAKEAELARAEQARQRLATFRKGGTLSGEPLAPITNRVVVEIEPRHRGRRGGSREERAEEREVAAGRIADDVLCTKPNC